MRQLIDFIKRYNYWLLFLILEVTSFVLLFKNNNYHHSLFFNSSNVISGSVYEVYGKVNSYFYLESKNRELMEHNILLEAKVAQLLYEKQKWEADKSVDDSVKIEQPYETEFDIIDARVVKNSINMADNYITINKGTADGLSEDIGVVGSVGIVGIVYKASKNYSLVISLLNSKSNISCKISGKNYFGQLRWEGRDSQFAYLRDLPMHADISVGDTIVTSGYSTVFPEGVMVGVADEYSSSKDGLSYVVKVKLFENFGRISDVKIIKRKDREEINNLDNQKTNKW